MCKKEIDLIHRVPMVLKDFTDVFHIVDCCSSNFSKRAVFHNSLLNSRAGQVVLLVGNKKKKT